MEVNHKKGNVDDGVEFYDSIFNNNHTPMLVIDGATGKIRDGNAAASNFYGYSRETLRNMNIGEINTLDKEKLFLQMNMAQNHHQKYFEFKHKLATGEIRAVEVYSGPVTINGEELLISIIHDIQYKKDMEKKLLIQETYFKSLYENSPEAVAVLDNHFNVVDVNRRFEEMFQYELKEIEGHNITEVLCTDDMLSESAYFKECIGKGNFIRKEIRRRRKDGSLLEISFLGYPIINGGGQIGVYGVYADITHIKETQRKQDKKLQIYTGILRSTMDSFPSMLAVYKPDFSIAFLNKAGQKFFEVENQQMEDLFWSNLLKNKLPEVPYYGLKVLETKSEVSLEKWIPNLGKCFEWYCSPICDEEGSVIFVVEHVRDVTENKLREEALREAKEKAETASRFKTQFVANVTHEIRTPMNGIVGIIDLMSDTILTLEQKEYFSMLRYSVECLSVIINDVLDIAKIEAGKQVLVSGEFNLRKLLLDAKRYFRIQAERKGIQLVFEVDNNLPNNIYGDSAKLNQVLFNLIANAIKFTDEGGVYVSVASEEMKANKAAVRFMVKDTGIGIPENQTKYLFEGFYQLYSPSAKKYIGTGLGLSISKELVELMGGTIQVDSLLGEGSTFTFNLPFDLKKESVYEQEACSMMRDHTKDVFDNLRILIAEDESINQYILKSFLEKKRCKVTIVSEGVEAMRILRENSFDLIMLDVYMPGKNGLELAKEIRELEKNSGKYTPIIIITAALNKEADERQLPESVDGWLAKPFGRNQLYEAIESIMADTVEAQEFNLQEIIESLDGSYELLEEVAKEFISEKYQQEFIGKVELLIYEKDYEKLKQQIHKFKGSISHFHIASFDELFVRFKECIQHQEYDNLMELLGGLKHEYNRFKRFLQEKLKS